ncbi:hypothetical protein [Flexibacterium corallicola]|uniref:hypothetical protein n=1 Tax=Flexibacterium corallicola TaxID=3037259 RepID=UPI00286EE2A0|nr:hypothetical protein [Pseudovibrio sp. M1P-2-3]
MKRFVIALAAFLLSSTAHAQMPNLAPWQEKALEKVFEYDRIEKAQWNTEDQFMLHSSTTGIAWNNAIDQMLCKGLLYSIDKPEGHSFAVTVWHTQTNDFLGIARCK